LADHYDSEPYCHFGTTRDVNTAREDLRTDCQTRTQAFWTDTGPDEFTLRPLSKESSASFANPAALPYLFKKRGSFLLDRFTLRRERDRALVGDFESPEKHL